MEEAKALQVTIMKRPIERPRKPVEVVILTPKVERQPFKRGKVRGSYTNWFEPSLWGPIYTTVR
jgi:hypothetical protein